MTSVDLKITVMFFSATGNCKRIAEKIASYFGKNAVLADITYSLKKRNKKENTDRNQEQINNKYNSKMELKTNKEWNLKMDNEGNGFPPCDLLFVVFPVYSQLCPKPITRFLKNLQFKGAIVPCVSYGSVSAGKALKQISRIFLKKGAAVLAGAEFASSHFYYSVSNLNNNNASDTDSGLNNEKSLNNTISLKESLAVNELCAKAVLRLNKNISLKKIPVRHFNPLSYFMPKKRAQIGVRLISLDKNICTKCQKCKNACPFGALNKNLKVNGKCQRCGFCVKNCKHNNKQFILCHSMYRYLKKHIDYSRNIEIY